MLLITENGTILKPASSNILSPTATERCYVVVAPFGSNVGSLAVNFTSSKSVLKRILYDNSSDTRWTPKSVHNVS